ncbi:metallophosphoesterase [Spirillospora sp. NPDC049024]
MTARSRRVPPAAAGLAAAVLLAGACGGNGHAPGAGTPGRSRSSTPAPSGGAAAGFAAFGDFGTGGARQREVADAMLRWAAAGHRIDALVGTGDNVYPDGDPALFRTRLDAPYAALRATRPMWITLGNHDVRGDRGADQLRHLGLPALPYERRLPGLQFLFMDADHPDASQSAWLESRLAVPGPRFRVVVFHQPAWSCSQHGSTPAVDERWVPILERHRVALVLNGHDHNYQRFVSAKGVTYVVTGGGGQHLYDLRAGCATPPRVAAAKRYHFTAVELRAGALQLTAVAADGEVIDRATIRPAG